MRIKVAPAPAHLPPSMIESVKLLPKNARLILFTRHSLRERSDKNGFASYALPLTPSGRILPRLGGVGLPHIWIIPWMWIALAVPFNAVLIRRF